MLPLPPTHPNPGVDPVPPTNVKAANRELAPTNQCGFSAGDCRRGQSLVVSGGGGKGG